MNIQDIEINVEKDNQVKDSGNNRSHYNESVSSDISCSSRQYKLRDIDLTCPICKQSYFKPRILNCLHTYCEDCIKNNITYVKKETYVKCLLCSELTKLPDENSVCMLPYNFFANNAMDYLMIQCRQENAILCTGCSDNSEAISRCVECSEFLCIQCVTAHRRFRVTKDHKIIPLDTLRYDKSTVHRPVYCPDHEPELFTYYCEVCEDLICKECTILQHRGHKYERLSEALKDRKPFIINLLDKNEKEKIPPISKAVDEVQDMAARLYARTVATKQAVKSCTDRCVREIESRCEELLTSIDDLYKEKYQILHGQQKDLQLTLMKNKSANQFVNYAFQHGSEAEIFELLDLMKMRLTTLNSKDLEYKEPDDNDVIDHVFNFNAVDKIADNLGNITTSRIFLAYTKLYGPGLFTAKVEIEAFFMIEVFDRLKERCCDNFSNNLIKVKVQAPEGFFVNNKIQNNKDGTFTVRFTPVTKGKHEVTVKIRGKSFPNNRFTVRVYEGIDYLNIISNYLYFGSRGVKPGEFKSPWSVALNQQGNMFITDRGNNRVQVFDKFGVFVSEFGTKGSKDGQFNGPEGIGIDQTGIIFVADSGNHRIQVFDPTGTFIGKFGNKGSGEGQLLHPSGLVIDRNGYIAVADRDNHRVQIFNADGNTILCFGSLGNIYGQMNTPTHITVTESNSYIISDSMNNRVVCYDSNGMYTKEIGGKGNNPGEFDIPCGIAVDREGFIVVSDSNNHRVQVLTQNFKYFSQFGVNGSEDVEFNYPSGVLLTNEGRVVVVDRCNNRIQVF